MELTDILLKPKLRFSLKAKLQTRIYKCVYTQKVYYQFAKNEIYKASVLKWKNFRYTFGQ